MKATVFRHAIASGLSEELEELAHQVIGAAIEVHSTLGPGLPEIVYRRALSHELSLRQIPHRVEEPVPVYYKGIEVGKGRIDLLIADNIIVELKVVETLLEVHRAQCLAYLAATNLKLAILINFNVAVLKDQIKRIIRTELPHA